MVLALEFLGSVPSHALALLVQVVTEGLQHQACESGSGAATRCMCELNSLKTVALFEPRRSRDANRNPTSTGVPDTGTEAPKTSDPD